MRKEFIIKPGFTPPPEMALKGFRVAKTAKEAQRLAYWACKVATTTGGWMCFESFLEYLTWKRQK